MNRLSIFILFLIFIKVGFAQQEQIYTHYDMNSLSVNPAYAGSNAKTTVSLLSRRQWTSLSGAPNYNTLTASHALNNDFAMGLTVKQGSIGEFKNTSPLNEMNVSVNLAYHKTLTNKLRLAVGLKLGYFNYSFDISKLDLYQNIDPIFSQRAYNINAPSTGFGTYLYSENSFIGFSCPQMIFIKSDETNYSNINHYQVTAGHVYKITNDEGVKFTTQIRYTADAPMQMDFNTHYFKDNIGSVGLFYRTEGDVGLMFMGEIKKNLKLFYSWDSKIKPINEYVRYSHEFGLQYSIPYAKTINRIIVPRFF